MSEPCQNGGTCNDSANGYMCLCADGYTGNNCEGKILLVPSSLIFIVQSTMHFLENIKECKSNPCQNNGTCVDGLNGYTCKCVDGFFSGTHCQGRSTLISTQHMHMVLYWGFIFCRKHL